MIQPFNIASIPNLHFGVGKISTLTGVAESYGSRVLLVTGAKSFSNLPLSRTILLPCFSERVFLIIM